MNEVEVPMTTDLRLHTTLTGFLNSLTARHVSQHTCIAYQTDLTQFFTWLLENDVTVVIYPKKLAVSQKTCHAAKRF
jgi:site-specific recombinase XerD